jgi:hypothetical protein
MPHPPLILAGALKMGTAMPHPPRTTFPPLARFVRLARPAPRFARVARFARGRRGFVDRPRPRVLRVLRPPAADAREG